MLARLWWKEWRVFGPACLLLVLAAAGVQWIYLTGNGNYARDGSATPIALIWAVLYAYAAGAAAFAGEREGKTIGFLDALPVGRRTLWLGKSSFAIATSLGLAIALIGLSTLATGRRDEAHYGLPKVAGDFAIWIVEGLAWGLFWSAVLANPLAAGALAVSSAGVVAFAANRISTTSIADAPWYDRARLIMAGLALAGSAAAMFGRIGRPRFRLPWPLIRVEPRPGPAAGSPSRPASVTRSLTWQAWREGRSAWVLALVVALWIPAIDLATGVSSETPFAVVLAALACLMLGISAFGNDNAAGTRRFLENHGVSPGAAWGRKVLVCGLALASLIVPLLALLAGRVDRNLRADERPLAAICLVAALLDASAIGVIGGMAGRRRITAGLVGILALIALAPVQLVAAVQQMVPAWTLFLSPLILIAASRAWAGDWLADRGGYRPHARLALLLAVPLGLEAVAYAGYRAWGEPGAPPLAAIATTPPGSIPPADDAAEAFRKAADRIWGFEYKGEIPGFDDFRRIRDDTQRIIEEGAVPVVPGLRSYLVRQQNALEAARAAAAMPRISVEEPADAWTEGGDPMVARFHGLGQILALDARDRQARGDLAGAWDDILAQLRMSGQLTTSWPNTIRTLNAVRLHHQGVGLAIDWASDPGQAPASIRRALDDVRALAPPEDLSRTIRVESGLIDRWLGLPAEELNEMIFSYQGGDRRQGERLWTRLGFSMLVAPPWEREHARRVTRRIFAGQLAIVAQEPWRRDEAALGRLTRGDGPELRGSMLARMLLPATEALLRPVDRELENRRALELTLALRLWQLEHGGEYPETLDALVPAVLDRLPIDPYSGRPFGYTRSEGQPVQPPIRADVYRLQDPPRGTRPGQRLLYSVGPDRRDDHAARSHLLGTPGANLQGDLIVPLPWASPAGPGQ